MSEMDVIVIASFIINIISGIRVLQCFKKITIEESRFNGVIKGHVVDYKRRRHSLDTRRSYKLLYHPVICYEYNGNKYESVSDVGYNKEYYRVGRSILIYCDVLNPTRIKTVEERKEKRLILINSILSTITFIIIMRYAFM